jgi:hypothetical protein
MWKTREVMKNRTSGTHPWPTPNRRWCPWRCVSIPHPVSRYKTPYPPRASGWEYATRGRIVRMKSTKGHNIYCEPSYLESHQHKVVSDICTVQQTQTNVTTYYGGTDTAKNLPPPHKMLSVSAVATGVYTLLVRCRWNCLGGKMIGWNGKYFVLLRRSATYHLWIHTHAHLTGSECMFTYMYNYQQAWWL